jgi:hypothetical protein
MSSKEAAKARMAQLARGLKAPKEDVEFPKSQTRKPISATFPERGQRGDFHKISATLPAALYEQVLAEVTRRKLAKENDADFSSVIREALVVFFSRAEAEPRR